MLAISLRSVRQAATFSATVPPRRSSGPSSSSGCRRALAAMPFMASPCSRITARSMRGAASSRATGTRTISCSPGRGRRGSSPHHIAWPRPSSRSSPVPSASPAAGGMVTRRAVTTSSPSSAAPSPGFIAKKAPGTCMAFLPDYAELHALSNFSFLRGASHPEELVLRSHALGYRALALTDECSLAGAVRAHFAAKECGLPLIHGTEITVEKSKLVLLATDRRSYGAISALITTGRRRSQKGTYSLTLADVEAVAPSTGALALWVPSDDAGIAPWLAERFAGRAWIAAELHCGPNDRAKLNRLRELGREYGLPLIAAGPARSYRSPPP